MRILSVRLSVNAWIVTERKICPHFLPYERTFSLVFWEKEWLWGRPLLPEILGQPARVGAKSPILNRDFEPIFARSASAITANEKVQLTIIESPHTRFPMSLRWSSYVALKSPKGGSKTPKTDNFRLNIAIRLKKVCYKVSVFEKCQRRSCKVFIVLTIRAKMIGGGTSPSTWNFGSNCSIGAKSPIFYLFSLVAPQPYHLAKKVQLALIGSLLRAFK